MLAQASQNTRSRVHDLVGDVELLHPEQRDAARRALHDGRPVLIAPDDPRPPNPELRIAVGYDGSAGSEAALQAARTIADRSPEPVSLDIVYVDDSATAEFEQDAHVVGSRRAAVIEWWLRDLVRVAPYPVQAVRRVGDPADELAAHSEDVDLLIIGTRGRAPLRRLFSPSVSHAVMETTEAPLLIVPRSGAIAHHRSRARRSEKIPA